jgi:riboflavin synthase
MFTGIIESFGKVLSVVKKSDYWSVLIQTEFDDMKLGDSVSVNGVCLTVTMVKDKSLEFDIILETLNKTNLNFLCKNIIVNLERCLKLSDRLDGHLVQGHIECTGKILSKKTNEGETKIAIEIDKEYLKYCIYKGSITLEGVSLTISALHQSGIEVSVIPYTYENTTLGVKKVGDFINIETDIISKYIERRMEFIK